MSKARDLADAEQEAQDVRIGCATCSDLRIEGDIYCSPCRMYWDDVSGGCFDDWPLPIDDRTVTPT
jgi:hypothetical protein